MQIIDSSVWVALFLDFDSTHKKASEIFSQIEGSIYLPYCVINEVATVLAYKHSKMQADSFLDFITDNEDIIIIGDEIANEINYYRQIEKNISFTDAAIIYLAEKFNLLLITFDKQIIKIIKSR